MEHQETTNNKKRTRRSKFNRAQFNERYERIRQLMYEGYTLTDAIANADMSGGTLYRYMTATQHEELLSIKKSQTKKGKKLATAQHALPLKTPEVFGDEPDAEIFHEGQEVYCLIYGRGIVQKVWHGLVLCVVTQFEDTTQSYTKDGKISPVANNTLYPMTQYLAMNLSIPVPEPQKWIPKVGEWIWVMDFEDSTPHLRKFVEMTQSGKYRCTTGVSEASISWLMAEPFVGELPSNIKKREASHE